MQQAEEAATETETESGARLHFVSETGVVQAKPAHGRAQFLELRGVDREQAAEHNRDSRAKTRQGILDRLAIVGDGVAHARVGDFFDRGGKHADLAGTELVHRRELGREHAGAVHVVGGVGAHHADALAFLEHAVNDTHQHNHAEIEVVPAVNQQCLECGIAVAFRRRQPRDDRFQHLRNVQPGLGGNLDRVAGIESDHILDLLLNLGRLGGGQVHLIEHRHDLVAVVDRLINVRQGLRFNALAGIDHQQRTLASGERAVDLIGEVHVTGRIDQIEDIVLAIARFVIEPHSLRLDGNSALALDVHGIEHLLLHLARLQPAGELNQPVGQRRFSMVDMGDDGEIADVLDWRRRHGGEITPGVQGGKEPYATTFPPGNERERPLGGSATTSTGSDRS